MKIIDFINELNLEFPSANALSGDRIGLQIKGDNPELTSVLFAYELNDDVIIEAVINKSELIVTFHPLIYNPLTSVTDDERVGHLVRNLVKNNISLYVIHTNFDTHSEGTNKILANILELKNVRYLQKIDSETAFGMGIVGEFESAMNISEFINLISTRLNSPVKFNRGKNNLVHKVAIVGGSGSSFLADAIYSGADAFITADLSYHNFHFAEGKIVLVDVGHYEMEQFNHKKMAEIVSQKCSQYEIKIMKSQILTNPVNYYPENNYKVNQLNSILNN
jgi:dinuclear metal center YbgI/SA1388 family protein